MDPAFERALERIPPKLRRKDFRFTVVLKGNKKPEGKNWANIGGANFAYGDSVLAGYLAEGHNYGLACGHGGLNVIDLDDLARLEELDVLSRIRQTFSVKTGRVGSTIM